MTTYTPDVWKVIRLNSPQHGTIEKVLAGWYGGFTDGDSWKMNSGITETREFDDRYEFDGYSGSTYVCYKQSERFSGLTSSVLQGLISQIPPDSGISIEVLNYEHGDNNVADATD